MSQIMKIIQKICNALTFSICMAGSSFLARGVLEAMNQPGREFPMKEE